MKIVDLATMMAALCLAAQPAFAARGIVEELKRPDSWFSGPDGRQMAMNILSHQAASGGWPKNTDTRKPAAKPNESDATFDNGATVNELRFLARIYQADRGKEFGDAFGRGLDYILNAQYPTGGWPQSHPPGRSYHRHITFNDQAMVNLMLFLREVATEDRYDFVSRQRRAECLKAFDLGIRCILKCQIRVNGKPTVWCAQHDEIDLRPRPARAYELVSLSGSESVGIVRLLMSLDHPDAATIAAVDGAVAWFESVEITRRKLVVVDDATMPGGKDRRLVEDAAAPPMWARFYEIGTNRPMFCDRDGVVKYSLAAIGHERRNGYSWLGNWPRDLIEKEYPRWKRSHLRSSP